MQKIYFDKNFSPAATLECGQVFRYKKEGDCYTVHALDKECKIYRDGDGYYMLSDDEKFFKNYFDFDGKYDIKLITYHRMKISAKWSNSARG